MTDRAALDQLRHDRAALVGILEEAGTSVADSGASRCPFHDDHHASAGVFEGEDGTWRFKCHACDASGDVIDLVRRVRGLSFREAVAAMVVAGNDDGNKRPANERLFPTAEAAAAEAASRKGGEVEAIYVWAADWHRARIRTRTGKTFCEIGRHSAGWSQSKPAKYKRRHPLYGAAQLGRDAYILIVEGEKPAEAGRTIGIPCVTPGNWSSPRTADWSPLDGTTEVWIWGDDDDKRERFEQGCARELGKLTRPPRIRFLRPQGLPPKGDLYDFIELRDGRTEEEMRAEIEEMAKTAELLEASAAQPSEARQALAESRWPDPPHEDAYHGLAGELVRLIEPHSEADPVALLVQFLVAFGNVVGRSAHFRVEGDQHFVNLFVVLVGPTSKGRKGTSWGHVGRLLRAVDSGWGQDRIMSGLSSGEGLIWQVRDPINRREPIREGGKKTGRVIDYQDVEVDPGEPDKRLLVVEAEFASALKVASREGNTLSPTIRQTWDVGALRILNKNSPARATGAHISIIGHVTRDELRRHLHATEMANGYANRFLWLCVRRSKTLPEGGNLREQDAADLSRKIAAAVEFARGAQQMARDDEARALWANVYPGLSEGRTGLLGAALSRAEAQVLRLSCVYALLDRSAVVRVEHLRAALALWEYVDRSAVYIFGSALGDPLADEIQRLLQGSPNGMTRTQIRDAFSRHKKNGEIDRALALLLEEGHANRREEESGGRPVEIWFARSSACDISDQSDKRSQEH